MDLMTISAWALWLVCVTLTLVLYIRVDVRDWGMVGMTTVLFGASVLTTRTMLRMYDLDYGGEGSLYAWRLLVIIGAPLAVAGYAAGVLRDPPPTRQIVGRLSVLLAVLIATAIWWW